jgi:hypothetical protein
MRWLQAQPDPIAALRESERGDWLLAVLAVGRSDHRSLAACALACVRTVLPLLPEGEVRPVRVLEVGEAWVRGAASPREVLDAARQAHELVRLDGVRGRVARSVAAALDTTTQLTAAHAAVRYAARALTHAQLGDPTSLAWQEAQARALRDFAELIKRRPWRTCPPDPELLRCLPPLQVAWDLVSERVGTEWLTTGELLQSFVLREALMEPLKRLPDSRMRDQALVRTLAEQIAAAPEPERLLEEVSALLTR